MKMTEKNHGGALMLFSILLMGALAVQASPIFFTGGVDGGGGKAVVCRDKESMQITKVEMLDLFEARTIYKNPNYQVHPIQDGEPYDNALRLFKGVHFGFLDSKADLLQNMTEAVVKYLEFTPDDVKLEPTEDSFHVFLPKSCFIEQAAVFTLGGSTEGWPRFFVDSEIWRAMDLTQKTALLMHETLYGAERQFFGEENSVRARHAIGLLMSDVKPVPFSFDRIPSKSLICSNHDKYQLTTEIVVTDDKMKAPDGSEVNIVRLSMIAFKGHYFLDNSSLIIANYNLNKFTATNVRQTETPLIFPTGLYSVFYEGEPYTIYLDNSGKKMDFKLGGHYSVDKNPVDLTCEWTKKL